MRKKKRLGVGARCTVLFKRLHPKDVVVAKFPNYGAQDRLDDLVVTKKEQVTRKGHSYPAIFFSSKSFPDKSSLYTCTRYAVVKEEGDPIGFFAAEREETSLLPAVEAGALNNAVPIERSVFFATGTAKDILCVQNLGLDVDDDNAPTPENIPTADTPVPTSQGLYPGQSWGWDGVDRRRAIVHSDNNAGFHNSWSPVKKGWVKIFLKLFMLDWLNDVCLAQTNKGMEARGLQTVSFGEMLRYIGLWVLMASFGCGFTVDDFFSTREYDEHDNPCPVNLIKYMHKSRFKAITRELRFTDCEKPAFEDKFWEVRQMIEAWCSNMAAVFHCAWVSCLDESMSIWHNRWTCPGWVYCPRKPHPFGNEYHSACCGITGIMYVIELVEGKDRPQERGSPEFEAEFGKTGGLLLRMLKSLFTTGRYVVLDSGFCVLKAILALREKGIFASALVKKRCYCLVPGEKMEEHFCQKNVGDVDAIKGEKDGVQYNIFGMKEPDYAMRIMATGGGLVVDESCKTAYCGNGQNCISFKYTRPFDWHFRYRHAVDDHNNLRHTLPSLEDTWTTQRWEIRVFTFLLAITEVNVYLTLKHFVCVGNFSTFLPQYIDFRRKFAWMLIDNAYIPGEERLEEPPTTLPGVVHDVATAPNHASEFRNRKWVCKAAKKYQQYTCKWVGCKNLTRTYCPCNPGYWLCPSHILRHSMDATKEAYE